MHAQVLCYVDRTSVAFAAPSMLRQLHFSPSTYGLGAACFFVGYTPPPGGPSRKQPETLTCSARGGLEGKAKESGAQQAEFGMPVQQGRHAEHVSVYVVHTQHALQAQAGKQALTEADHCSTSHLEW